MSGLLIVNPSSGTGSPTPDELRQEAEARGVRVHVLADGDDAVEVARDAEADALGSAGGDGSLATVAQIAIERDLPFVCVPFGTRNHFARDLGLDRADPLGALAAFEGEERRVDVGRVNERLFLNNVSLGLYARLVHRREHHRRRRQLLARLRAYALLARHRHPLELSLDGRRLSARIVLVANNSYRLELLSIGERERLDEGCLHVYTAEGLVPGGWNDERGERFTIQSSLPRLQIAIDGEPTELETPLRFSIEPRALRVLLPRSAARAAQPERSQ